MNKKLGSALHPGVWPFFLVMLSFAIPTALNEQYFLAGIELAVTVVSFVVYLLYRSFRRKQLQTYVQKFTDEISGTEGAKQPFPMVLIRLYDGGIVYANDDFIKRSGMNDTLRTVHIEEILPGFSSDWLSVGKTEAPADLTLEGRRYRIHGTLIRGDDQQNTPLGLLYLADLTEFYQIRDEYIRSRPREKSAQQQRPSTAK